MRTVILLLTAMATQAAQQGVEQTALYRENPMEKVPLVGSQFKVDPVSTAMQCVISLTIQYMLVYTALALCRTAAEQFNLKFDNLPIQNILETACLTVQYAPMLAVLFLGCRMRVTFLTRGQGNPPEWMQMWMYACTYAVLAMTLIVCAVPIFTGDVINVDTQTGDIHPEAKPFTNWIAAGVFTVVQYLIMIGLYVGVICIIYGIVTFEPPQGTWPGNNIPPVSPAVGCVMILSCMYFAVYAAVQVSKTFSLLTGSKYTKFETAMLTSTNAMNFAPMLAILFIGARMRALQMDPVNGAPQAWAQNCFYMCTYATAAQVLISIAVPLVLQGEVKQSEDVEGDMNYKVQNATLGTVLTVGRYIIMLCVYVGFSCVIWSVFTIEHPNGPQDTPPISVTMQCVINLTVQYFFVYLMIWIGVTVKEFTQWELPLLQQTMLSCKGTINFCPMLAILFVATRMRALLMTNNKGAPQGWCQDGMYMATWAVLIQFLMCLLVPICTGKPAALDEDGHAKWEPENRIALTCVQVLKWITFIFLYGGIITVVVGVYTMTPETANGRGAVPLVGDGRVPGLGIDVAVPGTDIGYKGVEEPYGPNDLPGVPNF